MNKIASAHIKHKENIRMLTMALTSCWHAANTYDGNYARACDHVMHIVSSALKTKQTAK